MTNVHDALKTETIHELLTKPLCFLHENQSLEQVISEINKEHYLADFKFNIALYFLDTPKGKRYDGAFYLELGYNNPHPKPTWISNDDSLTIVYLVEPETYVMKIVPDEGKVQIFSSKSLENLVKKIPDPTPSHWDIFKNQLIAYFGENTVEEGTTKLSEPNHNWTSSNKQIRIEYEHEVESFPVFFVYLSTKDTEYEGSGHTLAKAMKEATESLLANQYHIPVDDFKKSVTPPAPKDDSLGFHPSSDLLYKELLKFFNEEIIKRGTFSGLGNIKTWKNEKETVIISLDYSEVSHWRVTLITGENEWQFFSFSEGTTLKVALTQATEAMLDSKFNLSLASF